MDLVRSDPPDSSVDTSSVVPPSPPVELSAEVAEGTEAYPSHELLSEEPVEPFELPSVSRAVRFPVDHRDTSRDAKLAELLREEAAAVVDVEGLGPAAARKRPPEVVRGLSAPLSKVGASHPQVSTAIVQDGGDVDMSPDPGDVDWWVVPCQREST